VHVVRLADGRTALLGYGRRSTVPGDPEDYLMLGAEELAAEFARGRIEDDDSVPLVAPLGPGRNIICVGLNYRTHADEANLDPPKAPLLFSKLASTIVGPDSVVPVPRPEAHLDYEAELAVVIGRPARKVPEAEARRYVGGYLCFNDLSDRDAQLGDGQWFRGKNFPGASPLGPGILPRAFADGVEDWRIACRVNGETRQDSSIGQMIFGLDHLVSYISHQFDLLPGDVIATGTPSGVGLATERWLAPGDVVEVEIDHCGVLRTTIGAVGPGAGG
jgi:2-keto-4-pentenoate hydratase/2-oxohepta-3-ene-1,7-dioic acid hydratase in catechol pathway